MNKLYNKLNSEIERAKLINQYDYDTMLNNFDRMKSIDVIKKNKKTEISKINKKWQEKTRQINLLKSDEKLFPAMEESKLLRKINELNSEESLPKIKNHLDHLELTQANEEEKRIKLEMSINSKLKKFQKKISQIKKK